MSADFLSQDEVDALLKGVTGEVDEAPEDAGPGSEVKNYDLGRQERIVRGRMPTLELINERFARYLRLGLFNYMQRGAEISVGPIKVQKYSEFIRNLVVPTNLNLVLAKPLRGTGLIVLDPNLVFIVVDNMFGGDGRFHTRVEGRDFTVTEQRIIQGMLGVIFEQFEKAWEPVFPLKFEYVRSEMNTQFANIATPAEVIVSSTFSIELSGSTADMHFCLPYSMVEPIRDVLFSTMHSEQASKDTRWTTMMVRQIQSAEVEMVVELGRNNRITFADVIDMKVGDVIPLTIPPLITASIDGVPVVACTYGVQNGQYALKIDHFVATDEENAEEEAPAHL